MNKGKVIIALAMMAVIVVCIVFSSLAWFVRGSRTAGTTPLTLTTDDPTFFTIGDVQTFQNMGNYMGQTGLAFYRYVERNDGDYTYIYEDDGIYEERASLEQVQARAQVYYCYHGFPISREFFDPEGDHCSDLLWKDIETGILTKATEEQIEIAYNLFKWDSVHEEYVFWEAYEYDNRDAEKSIQRILDSATIFYYDGETYTAATREQIICRASIYAGWRSFAMASPDQLAAGRYLYCNTPEGFVNATDGQIDEALRVLYSNIYTDNPIADDMTYSVATRMQILDRLGLFYGEDNENIATTEQIHSAFVNIYNGGTNTTIYTYNAGTETYSPASADRMRDALQLYYKDRGVIMEKTFDVFNFTATKTQSATYYWSKSVSSSGDYISSTIYKAEVSTIYPLTGTYRIGDTMYFEVLRQRNGSTVYTVYNVNGLDVYRNYGSSSNCSITYPYMSSNSYARIKLEGSSYIHLRLDLDNKTKDVVTYDLKDVSGNNYELDLDKLNDNVLSVYRLDGSVRRLQYRSSNPSESVDFRKTAVTIGGTNYAGSVLCSKINSSAEGTCRTVNYDEDGNYTASNSDHILQRYGTAGNYTYKIFRNNAAKTELYNSTDANTNIEVRSESVTTYAIEDATGMEDAVYNVAKQFNISFPATSYEHCLAVVADKIGIVPLHNDAITMLEETADYKQEVYYTYIDDGTVDFGLDYSIEQLNETTIYTTVLNYDGSKQTRIMTRYYAYNPAAHGALTYVTTNGYLLYVKGEGEDEYIQIDNTMDNMSTLEQLQEVVDNGTVDLYVSNNNKFGLYTSRFGNIVYHNKTVTTNGLYYYGDYPIATNEQIAEGEDIFYMDSAGNYYEATTNMLHASGILYYSPSGLAADCDVATTMQIKMGNNLFYFDGTAYQFISKEIIDANRVELYHYDPDREAGYSEASSAQVKYCLSDLFARTIDSSVYSVNTGLLLYGEENGHSVSTTMRTMYMLSPSSLFTDFYVEVDIYNVTDDVMLGTFYPDEAGVLDTSFQGDMLLLDPTESEVAYRCVIRVYFMDGYSYNNLHSDTELTYSYQYDLSTPMYVVSDYGELRAFTYSDEMFIGSNFLLRLNIITIDQH